MTAPVIVLFGPSSAGKSTTAAALGGPVYTVGIDTFTPTLLAGDALVHDDPAVLDLILQRWGVATARTAAEIAERDVTVVVDWVFHGGVAEQTRWYAALGDRLVLWVRLHASAAVLDRRERRRRDRVRGISAAHRALEQNLFRDLEIDTAAIPPVEVAETILATLTTVPTERKS